MACVDIFDAFRVATESLSPEIYRIASFDNIFLNLIPRGMFVKGQGTTRSVFTIGNVLPTDDEPTWNAIVLANGENGGACTYNYTDVEVGFNENTYSPSRRQIRGPVFCKDDMYFDFNVDAFLSGYVDEMAKYASYEFGNKLFIEYIKLVPALVANANAPISDPAPSTFYTLPLATSELTQEMLDKAAVYLTQVGRANNPDGMGFTTYGPSGPLYSLYIGVEASQLIKQNNAEFRQDIRWADPSKLLFRLGATEAIKNFRHVPWVMPPRYNYNNGTGTYVRVPTFVTVAGTKGNVTEINPDYLDPTTAPYEGAVVLSRYVLQADIVEPVASHPGNVKFDPSSYMGEWTWKTGNDAVGPDCYDPLHKRGRHFAEWIMAPRPLSTPKSGMFILFKRCPIHNYQTVTCT